MSWTGLTSESECERVKLEWFAKVFELEVCGG